MKIGEVNLTKEQIKNAEEKGIYNNLLRSRIRNGMEVETAINKPVRYYPQPNRDYVEIAVYEGEKILAMGTYKECAEKMRVKEKSVRFLTTPSAHKRAEGTDRIIAIKLDGDE